MPLGQWLVPLPSNSIDTASWLMHGERNWLWVMANPAVASFQIHSHRSNAAFSQLMVNWAGLLMRDGYAVSWLLNGETSAM